MTVSARNDHSVPTNSETVKLVDDIPIFGHPPGTPENTDPDRGQVMTPYAHVPAALQTLMTGCRTAVLDPQVLIEVEQKRVIIRFFRPRYLADNLTEKVTRVDVEIRYLLVAEAGKAR